MQFEVSKQPDNWSVLIQLWIRHQHQSMKSNKHCQRKIQSNFTYSQGYYNICSLCLAWSHLSWIKTHFAFLELHLQLDWLTLDYLQQSLVLSIDR